MLTKTYGRIVNMITCEVLNNIVPIGFRGNPSDGATVVPIWIGTGFIVRERLKDTTRLYLITNKHVVQQRTEILVRLRDVQGTPACSDGTVVLYDPNGARFSAHPNPNVDIVAISIDSRVQKNGHLGFDLDSEVMTLQDMKEQGAGEGDVIYSLGFPMGIVNVKHSYPICRMGCISSISSAYDGLNPIDFIVDAQSFPGNSGGPIVIKSQQQTDATKVKLIGVLCAYIPYQEVLISQQTQKARSTMEENSGLTIVHPVDRILDVVRLESARIDMVLCNRSPNL